MAAPSEQISTKWIEGAKRECVHCGRKITNLAKQVGVVRTVYPARRREILCTGCVRSNLDEKIANTRRELGLKPL